MVLQVQILVMTCPICEIGTLNNQQSGKVQIRDVSDVKKSKILIVNFCSPNINTSVLHIIICCFV